MIFVKDLKENQTEILRKQKELRGLDVSKEVTEILTLEEIRKNTQANLDQVNQKANDIAKQMPQLFKEGKSEEASKLKTEAKNLKLESRKLAEKLEEIKAEQKEWLFHIPNVPNELVPAGKDDTENEVIVEHKQYKTPSEKKVHWDILNDAQLADFDKGTKITGAGFPLFTGKGSRLQRALINFFLDENSAAGYLEHTPLCW